MTLGEKIQKLRRQSGLSQEALAEKLNVTRQTISKWELDQSTPDLMFITKLSDLYGVSADYLIREEMEEPNTLQTPRKKRKFHFTECAKRYGLIALSAAAIIATFVCVLCDYFTDGYLTWSLVTFVSIVAGWCICVPPILAKEKILLKTLLAGSAILIPYLALLAFLLKNPILFKMGACISIVSLAAVWLIYVIFGKYLSRLWRAFGITFLLIIPVVIIDNHIAAAFVSQGNFDRTSDLLNSLITFMLAAACFGMDYLQRRKNRDNTEMP